MLCIPLGEDQPLVAKHVCKNLELGLSLDYRTMDSGNIREAIYEILNNKSYFEKIREFSLISQHYKGHVNASNLIMNFLKNERD